MNRYCLIIALAALFASCSGSQAVFSDQMKLKMADKNFTVKVNTAEPMSGPMVVLTSPYSIKVKNDSIFSYLPYYGRAYSVPYGGGKALNFDDKMISYTQRITAKGMVEITVSVKNDEDTYKYRISLSPTGSASITVNSQNRQPISFSGTWK
jgi:hypothetical protein